MDQTNTALPPNQPTAIPPVEINAAVIESTQNTATTTTVANPTLNPASLEIPITSTQTNQPQPTIPNIDEMATELKSSGILAGGIDLTTPNMTTQGPLAAIQPSTITANPQQISKPTTEPEFPTIGEEPHLAKSSMNRTLAHLRTLLNHPVKRVIAIALTLQGLRGIGQSLNFIFVEYPAIEQELLNHTLSRGDVNEYAIGAIVMVTSTVLSLFFAMQLTFAQNKKVVKTFSTITSVGLVIGNQLIHDYLAQFDYSAQTESFFTTILSRF